MELTEQAIHLLAKVAKEVQDRFIDFSDRRTVGSMSTASITATTSSIPHEELESKGIIIERRMTWNIRVSSKVIVGSDNLLRRRKI